MNTVEQKDAKAAKADQAKLPMIKAQPDEPEKEDDDQRVTIIDEVAKVITQAPEDSIST